MRLPFYIFYYIFHFRLRSSLLNLDASITCTFFSRNKTKYILATFLLLFVEASSPFYRNIMQGYIILPEDKRLSKIIWMNEALGTLIRNVESHIRIRKMGRMGGITYYLDSPISFIKTVFSRFTKSSFVNDRWYQHFLYSPIVG
jgi:hypothetical protein